jgi:hypothetical protein
VDLDRGGTARIHLDLGKPVPQLVEEGQRIGEAVELVKEQNLSLGADLGDQ